MIASPVSNTRAARHRRRLGTSRAVARACTMTALVTIVALTATVASAAAQAGTSSTTTPPVTLPAENPGAGSASLVFFGVSGVIVVGAIILYLRNRGASRR